MKQEPDKAPLQPDMIVMCTWPGMSCRELGRSLLVQLLSQTAMLGAGRKWLGVAVEQL